MAILVEIPLEYYRGLLGRCVLESREYRVLLNAAIDHVPPYIPDGNVAALVCSEADAKLLLERAQRFYPVAASFFEEALRSPGYRKANSGDTWHSSPNCTQWPQSDFRSSWELRPNDQLCNECIAKGQIPGAQR